MSPGPAIRGWCPGALRPMASGDGLILRLRPPLAVLTPAQTEGIAAVAETCGNGLVAFTRRAHVQLRGLSEATLRPAQERLAALGLIDLALDAEAEARLNILCDPFHGPGDGVDQPALWQALRAALLAVDAPRLPAKFGFALDCGPRRRLDDESADIRIETGTDAPLIVRADGAATGRAVAGPAEAVALAIDLARWFAASGGVGPDGRGRMKAHLARGLRLPEALAGTARPAPAAPLADSLARIVGFDFGTAEAAALRRLSRMMGGALRLTPWRGVFAPDLADRAALAADPDLILSADDPRHRRFACVGAPRCPAGAGDPRALARRHRLLPPPGRTLHIAGCAKGCAHPAPADVTLTLLPGAMRLARRGRAGEGGPAGLAEARAALQEPADAP